MPKANKKQLTATAAHNRPLVECDASRQIMFGRTENRRKMEKKKSRIHYDRNNNDARCTVPNPAVEKIAA